MGQALPFGTVIQSDAGTALVLLCATREIEIHQPSVWSVDPGEHLMLSLGDGPSADVGDSGALTFLDTFDDEQYEWTIVEDPAS